MRREVHQGVPLQRGKILTLVLTEKIPNPLANSPGIKPRKGNIIN